MLFLERGSFFEFCLRPARTPQVFFYLILRSVISERDSFSRNLFFPRPVRTPQVLSILDMRFWSKHLFLLRKNLFLFEVSAYAAAVFFFVDEMRCWGKDPSVSSICFCLRPVRTPLAFFFFF